MVDRRVFLIVLDSYGIGELPDAEDFGDKGSNTLRSITASKEYDTLLIVSSIVQKLLSLIMSHLFIFVFISISLGGGSKRILL